MERSRYKIHEDDIGARSKSRRLEPDGGGSPVHREKD
jgi:hypothetical protein